MHHTGFTTDIAGLREQIKGATSREHLAPRILTPQTENATLLFPHAVQNYVSTHPDSINEEDAFNILVRTSDGLLRRKYQAILTCEVRRIVDGKEVRTIDVAAMGDSASQVCEAMLNLLEVVSEGVTKALLDFGGVGVSKSALAEGRGRYLDRAVDEVKRVS